MPKKKLTELFVKRIRPDPSRRVMTWDTQVAGLVLQVHPNSRAYKFIYSMHGRVRWFHIGDALCWPLSKARAEARRLRVEVDKGNDPQADKRAQLSAGSFAELVERYFEEHAKRKNRSWEQAH